MSVDKINSESDFQKERKEWESLWEIKKEVWSVYVETQWQIERLSLLTETQDNIFVSNAIIKNLLWEWLLLKNKDELGYINALTLPGNRIKWNKNADTIYLWDILKIKIDSKYVILINNNGEEKIVWEVMRWFKESKYS